MNAAMMVVSTVGYPDGLHAGLQDLTPLPCSGHAQFQHDEGEQQARRAGEADDQTHLHAREAVLFEAPLEAQDRVGAGEVEGEGHWVFY